MASDENQESRYKSLAPPEFKSSIPPHVLAKLPQSERYLVEMVSKMEDRDRWIMAAVMANRQASQELDIRLARNEAFISKLTSKWAVVTYVSALVIPVLLKVFLEYWIK